jgi:hypothetical protein
MWGVRWITFGTGGAACAGFADAEARTLKLLVQRPGEIYVQRLVLRRPGDPGALPGAERSKTPPSATWRAREAYGRRSARTRRDACFL